MRIAIVGANLLGTSTAFYIRRALDSNSADKSTTSEDEQATASTSEIVVFDRLSRVGGYKYETLCLSNVETVAGTAAGVDVRASPIMAALLKDVGMGGIVRKGGGNGTEWAIYDWDNDEYKLGRLRSRVCEFVRTHVWVMVLLQVMAFVGLWYFWGLFARRGFLRTFVKRRHFSIRRALMFLGLVGLGGGILPIGWLIRFYSWAYYRVVVALTGGMTYGGYSLSILGEIMGNIRDHWALVVERDSASSCVTLGHLLSASGFAKYAKASTVEKFGMYRLHANLLKDVVAPGLGLAYANSACEPGEKTNALATLCNMMATCPMPISFRGNGGGRYFDVTETKDLCKNLIEKATAKLRLGVEVRAVNKVSKNMYDVTGTDENGKLVSLGHFDSVVLAAVIDPKRFNTDVVDLPLDDILALNPAVSGMPPGEVRILNTARHISLIEGELNAGFFNKTSAAMMADRVLVLNSVNCLELVKVGKDIYRVVSGEKPEKGSSLADTMFKEVRAMASIERKKPVYHPAPLRNLHGSEAPDFILGTRFLNAACVDRIGNDVSLDLLSAKNTASFFRDGVATWK